MSKISKLKLLEATEEDAKQIVELLIRVYNDDLKKWSKTEVEAFIPGYDSEEMQKFHMKYGAYYKIMLEEKIVGVILASNTGTYHDRIDRLYIDVEYQDKKLGTEVMNLIEKEFPYVTVWTLDTSKKSLRNQHFYEKLGYTKEYEDEDEIFYKKIIENAAEADSQENEKLSKTQYAYCNMSEADFYSSNLRKSKFTDVNLNEVNITNTSMQRALITNVNIRETVFGDIRMDDIEICHASLGAAYFHDTNLGWFSEEKPIKFERCDLKGSKIIDTDLSNVEIEGCNIKNMKIDGISVEEMIKIYKEKKS